MQHYLPLVTKYNGYFMLAIKEIYNGKNFLPSQKFNSTKNHQVIITILGDESPNEDTALRNLNSTTNSFDFWNNQEEDMYQEYIK